MLSVKGIYRDTLHETGQNRQGQLNWNVVNSLYSIAQEHVYVIV